MLEKHFEILANMNFFYANLLHLLAQKYSMFCWAKFEYNEYLIVVSHGKKLQNIKSTLYGW